MAQANQNVITRSVRVDRTRTLEEVTTAFHTPFCPNLLAEVPQGEGEEVDVHFFNGGWHVHDWELEKMFADRGLKPCDPLTLATVNEVYPDFSDENANGTCWKDSRGEWCFLSFRISCGRRCVNLESVDDDWRGFWVFAGVRDRSREGDPSQ